MQEGSYELILCSILYNSTRPVYNFSETNASVTPNLAKGEISAVPYLSIAECYPAKPLACNPNCLAISLSFF